jgi:cytochrome P450
MSICTNFDEYMGQFLLGAVIGGITTALLWFYWKCSKYPPGPFPVPLLGNILMLRGVNKHLYQCFEDIGNDYKNGIYTFWLGPFPIVIISDAKLSLEAFKKHQFAGRPQLPGVTDTFAESGSIDVAFADFTKEYEALRKVSHAAIKKYAVADKLAETVGDVVDDMFEDIRSREGFDGEIELKERVNVAVFTILLSASYGEKFKLGDKKLDEELTFSKFFENNSGKITLIFLVPLFRYFFFKTAKFIYDALPNRHARSFLQVKYHEETLDVDNIRDFTDALLTARREAEDEMENDSNNSRNKQDFVYYLRNSNIINAVDDLLAAGSDSTKHTILWVILMMAVHSDMQERICQEVGRVIGYQDLPKVHHRKECNYLAAFIAEVLRFRPVAPLPLLHKTTVDVDIGGHTITKGTVVLPLLASIHHMEEFWENPEVFEPERFLDRDGNFIARPNQNYIPFGAGRRGCIGEKMALADIFFFISRFIQKTKGYRITLNQPVDLNGDYFNTGGWVPNDYKISLKRMESL